MNYKRISTYACAAFLLAMGIAISADKKGSKQSEYVKKVLSYISDCEKYSEKSPYSSTAPYMALGYDKDEKPVKGAIVHSIKTYSKVTGILVVRKDGEKYIVDKAEIIDLEKIKDAKKRKKAEDALKHIQGQVIKDGKKKQKQIDAITGATRFANSIFTTFDKMAKSTLKEMEENPSWTKKEFPDKKASDPAAR